MTDDPPDNVAKFPVRFRQPPEDEKMLTVVDRWRERDGCNHIDYYDPARHRQLEIGYLIREGETEVECQRCGTKLDPMFVLLRLAKKETMWEHNRKQAEEARQRLENKTRTTCEHCGKMTRVKPGPKPK